MVTGMMSLAAGNHVGDGVTVLWTDGQETRVGYGHVASEVPFAVEIDGSEWPSAQTEVRLVRDQGDRWVAGKAHVTSLDHGLVMLRNTQWEEPSQRVFERRSVDWPATLRILDDRGTRETFQVGLTIDVSLGGAGILLEDAPEVGSLVEYRALPRGEKPMRAIAVVVRRHENQIGLAFLYMWGAGHVETEYHEELRRVA